MQKSILISILIFISFSCQQKKQQQLSKPEVDWQSRITEQTNLDHLVVGQSYLPVYSHIYHIHEERLFDLTITISIRNVSLSDTMYLLQANYYNTEGVEIRQYLDKPVFVKPMETLEIVISEDDKEGGSGANFVFDWAVHHKKNPPLFEAVMISTYSKQGISYTTRGVQVFN